MDGNEAKEDIYHNVPEDGVYSIKVTREEPISTDVTIDLEDTRNEVRYRLSNQTTYTTKDGANRYKLTHTLTKPNDNRIKLYVKDYQYPERLSFEGKFIDSITGNGINDHIVWLIPEINSTLDKQDAIRLTSPTKAVYKNESDSYDPQNIEDGYFSTTYTQNRIAALDKYPDNSKYLTQRFKIVVNSTKNETSPLIEATDFMNTIEVKNDGQTSNYIYVDKQTTYTDN